MEGAKKRLSAPAATVIAAVITGVLGLFGGLISKDYIPFPSSAEEWKVKAEAFQAENADLKDSVSKLKNRLSESVPAPEGSVVWTDSEGKQHRYWICDACLEWEDAKAFCESLGGHLATITSPNEQDFIEKYAEKVATPYDCLWIGVMSNNGNWNKLVTGEILETGDYSHWHKFLGSDGYAAFSNYRPPYYLKIGEDVEAGYWVRLPNPSQLASGEKEGVSLKDGWLICEWDYE